MVYKLIAITLIALNSFSLIGQTLQNQNVCLNLRTEKFVIGLDNPLDIVYPQSKPIELKDISAEFQHYKSKTKRTIEIFEKNGSFSIRPDSVGYITISVKTKDGIKAKTLQTKLMMAVGRLSRFRSKQEGKIPIGQFRAQMGIIASLEGYGFDAKCTVLEYEIIRIDSNEKVSKHINIGGRFDDIGRSIIQKAQSGDLYVFRKIYYKCSGDDYKKRLEDMTFEIK